MTKRVEETMLYATLFKGVNSRGGEGLGRAKFCWNCGHPEPGRFCPQCGCRTSDGIPE